MTAQVWGLATAGGVEAATWVAVFCLAALLDALYSGMETGAYMLNRVRLDLHADAGHWRPRYWQRLLGNYNRLLAILLLGTNIMRYVEVLSIARLFTLAGLGEHADLYTMAVATPVMFILSDTVPKQVFQRLDEKPMYRLARLLKISDWLFTVTGLTPLVRGVTAALLYVTGAGRSARPLESYGVHAAIAEGQASGIISHFQSVMADRVMSLTNVSVADAMRPLAQAVRAEHDITREGFIDLISRHDHSRIPLLDAAGAVCGIVDVYDVITEPDGPAPASKARPPFALPGTLGVTEALYRMQRAHRHMAVVTGKGGAHVGIVTIKDLVEEIVGELKAW